MDEWSISAEVAISLFLAASVIMSIYVYQGYGKAMIDARYKEQAAVERIQEYRKYQSYDDKDLYCQDVVSLIFECRDGWNVEIVGVKMYDHNTPDSEYSSERIFSNLDINSVYHSTVVKGGNGEVTGFRIVKKA